jgi:transmembrane sensor
LGVLASLAVLLHSRAFVRRDSFLARTPTHIVESQPMGGPNGSAITTLLTPDSELVPEPDGGGRAFSLRKGAARFVVSHDEAHPFRVRVGALLIEDVGTVFTVRLSNATAEVSVDEGRLRIAVEGRSFELGPGERRVLDTQNGDLVASDERNDRAAAEAPASAPRAAAPAWRPLAESGRFGEAYESLQRAGRGVVRDEAGDLLLAADVARLSGHPLDAVPFLDQLLRSRASDPRAGLAAFTLGRVLLDELGRPAEAASAFDRARKAGGPLAEDALAREVEASSRAGDVPRARSLAIEYERLYPNGRRSRSVAKFGGLE